MYILCKDVTLENIILEIQFKFKRLILAYDGDRNNCDVHPIGSYCAKIEHLDQIKDKELALRAAMKILVLHVCGIDFLLQCHIGYLNSLVYTNICAKYKHPPLRYDA